MEKTMTRYYSVCRFNQEKTIDEMFVMWKSKRPDINFGLFCDLEKKLFDIKIV